MPNLLCILSSVLRPVWVPVRRNLPSWHNSQPCCGVSTAIEPLNFVGLDVHMLVGSNVDVVSTKACHSPVLCLARARGLWPYFQYVDNNVVCQLYIRIRWPDMGIARNRREIGRLVMYCYKTLTPARILIHSAQLDLWVCEGCSLATLKLHTGDQIRG